MIFSINDAEHNSTGAIKQCNYTECHILFIVMLSVVSVVMLNVVMLNVVMLSVIMLSVIMLNVVMQSVAAQFKQFLLNVCTLHGEFQLLAVHSLQGPTREKCTNMQR
jgi:hypothetical protein